MKKFFIFFSVIAIVAITETSCAGTKSCTNKYGKTINASNASALQNYPKSFHYKK